ncbi:MAG: winged helix-turn-helix domain-containing protein [Bacteroidales bacterium]|nr:winged helix-turn-helix domain-containing protein [Bacteroidales bacterium]
MSDAIGGAIGGAIELTPRQEEILNIIKEDNKISYRAIAEKLNINESAALKHLNKLKAKGGHCTINKITVSHNFLIPSFLSVLSFLIPGSYIYSLVI